jgi:hypothetical protein
MITKLNLSKRRNADSPRALSALRVIRDRYKKVPERKVCEHRISAYISFLFVNRDDTDNPASLNAVFDGSANLIISRLWSRRIKTQGNTHSGIFDREPDARILSNTLGNSRPVYNRRRLHGFLNTARQLVQRFLNYIPLSIVESSDVLEM